MSSASVACGCVSSYGHAHSLEAAIPAIHWHGSILHWALAVTAGKPGILTFSPSMSSTKAHVVIQILIFIFIYTYQKSRAWEASVEWARRKACRAFRLFAIIQWPLTVIANGQRSSIFAPTIYYTMGHLYKKFAPTKISLYNYGACTSTLLILCHTLRMWATLLNCW